MKSQLHLIEALRKNKHYVQQFTLLEWTLL